MNREEIYDTKIGPLISQIVDICKEHGIPMLAEFYIPTDEDGSLACTTALIRPEAPIPNNWPIVPDSMLLALAILMRNQEARDVQ